MRRWHAIEAGLQMSITRLGGELLLAVYYWLDLSFLACYLCCFFLLWCTMLLALIPGLSLSLSLSLIFTIHQLPAHHNPLSHTHRLLFLSLSVLIVRAYELSAGHRIYLILVHVH